MSKLAILGGEPAVTEEFPHWPEWGDSERSRLMEVLESGYWGLMSPVIDEWEERFARLQGARYATSTANGTIGLVIALQACGIGPGDEVIVPSYSFMATASAVLWVGAIPVFADIQAETFNLDPESARGLITEKTRAIIPVHIAGCPCDMDALKALAEEHDLVLLEDAAQAHGALWNSKGAGTIGAIGSLSFQSSKNLCAGEGGMLVTDDQELWERCVELKNCGRPPDGAEYEHHTLGTNARMGAFQAAILLAQAERFHEQFTEREKNWSFLRSALAMVPGIDLQERDPRVDCHALHLLILRYNPEGFAGLPRETFMAAMEAEGVPVRPGYRPLHLEKAFLEDTKRILRDRPTLDYTTLDLPVTLKVCNETSVWIRQNALLGDTTIHVEQIAEAVRKISQNAGGLVKA